MKKNGYNVVELVVVLSVFSIFYFTAAFMISKTLDVDFLNDSYEHKIAYIEDGAVMYAKLNEDLFKDNKTIYVTVEDLVRAHTVYSSNGVVEDPRSDGNNLNNVKVKITNENNKIKAKILT